MKPANRAEKEHERDASSCLFETHLSLYVYELIPYRLFFQKPQMPSDALICSTFFMASASAVRKSSDVRTSGMCTSQ